MRAANAAYSWCGLSARTACPTGCLPGWLLFSPGNWHSTELSHAICMANNSSNNNQKNNKSTLHAIKINYYQFTMTTIFNLSFILFIKSVQERMALSFSLLYSLERGKYSLSLCVCVANNCSLGSNVRESDSVNFNLRLPSWRIHFYCTIEALLPLPVKITRSCTKRQTEREKEREGDRQSQATRKPVSHIIVVAGNWWPLANNCCSKGGCECGCE